MRPPKQQRFHAKHENGPPRSLSILDDPKSCTILDTPSRVLELGLPIDLGPSLLRQLLEVNLTEPHLSVFRTFHNPSSPFSGIDQMKKRDNERIQPCMSETHQRGISNSTRKTIDGPSGKRPAKLQPKSPRILHGGGSGGTQHSGRTWRWVGTRLQYG